MAEHDDGFLARWSRRKHAARAAEREQEAAHGAAEVPTRPAEAHAPEGPDAPDRAPALPDPATLDASSDFSVFLGKDVPVETQRAALRRLWRLDPIYNRIDGLDDYCADFTDQATVVQGLRTAYKVGRGLLERTDEPAAPPASAASGPAAAATLAPSPEVRCGGEDAPAPVDASSLRPAVQPASDDASSLRPAVQPASVDARSAAVVPPGQSDATRAGIQPMGGGGRNPRGRVRPRLSRQS